MEAWSTRIRARMTPTVARQAVRRALGAGKPDALYVALARAFAIPPPEVKVVERARGPCARSCVRPSGVIVLALNFLHTAEEYIPHVPLPRGVPHAFFVCLHEFGHYLQHHGVSSARWGNEADADAFAQALLHCAGYL